MTHIEAQSDGRRREDALRLYRAVFGDDPSPVWVQRFVESSALLHGAATAQERTAYRNALDAVTDLEALEVAARYRRKLRLLSDSLRLAVYIAESEPHTQHFFVKRRPSVMAALVALGS
jgi:hypothetical protein